jgi:hypothetical protein
MALAMIVSAACASLSGRVAADADIRSPTSDPAQPFNAVPTASLDHLAALRGGLRVGALDVEFAANVRTLVNGTLVLESTTNLTPGGTMVTQSNLPAIGMNPETLSFVGANPSGVAGQMGVVIEGSSGVTTALHSVTRDQILGVILTTASNQQISQEINVQVSLGNFGRFQDAARGALFSGRLLGSLNPTN